ncbi:MAG: hypothetical protein GF398_01580 [Chitinivibrionales bacterium]|nr:hypothetical protein [Chitinivibrionales bacterium]
MSNPFESRDGTMMIVSVMGASEGENTNIGLYRNEGSGWDDPVIINGPASSFDPTMLQADDGTIFCFYYEGCCDDQKFRKSSDDGKTWGQQIDVNSNNDIGFSEQNNAKRHPNGDWFAMESTKNPTSAGTANAGDAIYVAAPVDQLENSSSWERHVIRSGWSTGDFLVVNPSETINGRYKNLRAILRCDFNCENQNSFAYSSDAGQTWDYGYDIPFSNIPACNDCHVGSLEGVHALGETTRSSVSLDLDGGPLLGWHVIVTAAKTAYCAAIDACSASAPVPQKYQRGSIAVLISNTGNHDDFSEVFLVRETGTGPENCDPGMIRSSDGLLHLTFTGRDAPSIRYVVFDPAVLVGATSAKSPARTQRKRSANVPVMLSIGNDRVRLPGMKNNVPLAVALYNYSGREVYRLQVENGRLEADGAIPRGTYIAKIISAEQMHSSRKIVLQ